MAQTDMTAILGRVTGDWTIPANGDWGSRLAARSCGSSIWKASRRLTSSATTPRTWASATTRPTP
jgi:hypothetical protein